MFADLVRAPKVSAGRTMSWKVTVVRQFDRKTVISAGDPSRVPQCLANLRSSETLVVFRS
jgi:hypothetical protein